MARHLTEDEWMEVAMRTIALLTGPDDRRTHIKSMWEQHIGHKVSDEEFTAMLMKTSLDAATRSFGRKPKHPRTPCKKVRRGIGSY